MKKIIPIILAATYILTFSFWSGAVDKADAAYTATLTFANPANGGSVTLNANNQFTIDVNVNTAGQNSGGADTYTIFDDSKLSFVSGVTGNFYDGAGPAVVLDSRASNRVAMGDIIASVSNPANGTGQVGRITFALKSGVTLPTTVTFSIYFTSQGATTDSNVTDVAFPFPDLLIGSSSATITINTYVPAPNITSLNPNHGPAAGGTSVTIAGGNFGATQGTSSVRFGSTTVTPTSWSATSIVAPSPAGTAGTNVNVTVVTSAGTSNGLSFAYDTVTTAPDITGVNPNSGPTAGGTSVTISGTNFGASQGTVSFGGTAATVNSWSTGSIAVTSPAHAAGAVFVVVTVSGGGQSTNNADSDAVFTYTTTGSTNPNISNINPTQGTENGGTSVTLTGTNFGSTEGTVTIGGQTVSAANVTWTGTSITFTTPAYPVSANTPVNVSITTYGSLTSNAVTFTYLNEGGTTTGPDISYLSPDSGRADMDITVTIYGTNFGSATGTVRFGSYTATILSWTDTQIQVKAPQLGAIPADIAYMVVVTRSDGQYDTAYYTYIAPPSTGGTTTTTSTGMPTGVWAGLISANGALAFLIKRRWF